MTQLMTEFLPHVRCTADMKRRLEQIVTHSVTPRITDHIRFAVDQYITQNWRPEFTADAGVPLEDEELTAT